MTKVPLRPLRKNWPLCYHIGLRTSIAKRQEEFLRVSRNTEPSRHDREWGCADKRLWAACCLELHHSDDPSRRKASHYSAAQRLSSTKRCTPTADAASCSMVSI